MGQMMCYIHPSTSSHSVAMCHLAHRNLRTSLCQGYTPVVSGGEAATFQQQYKAWLVVGVSGEIDGTN